ncbi:hypothetical protein RB3711 [Rhodopirellula baltica SH 1]|uniref:Uncharacterized protein n=1 Tax=Rhodopirellula baltica (strain DSM 10527 / NCIMB 13988 / SH1) TaxID=243090 RepID=Q7UTS0_RHOBA|nr:hypothetical protein RB3711 [Rhodopirellula baltica SH 1]
MRQFSHTLFLHRQRCHLVVIEQPAARAARIAKAQLRDSPDAALVSVKR